MKKRGQVTIFIIIAVIIVVLGLLIYFFYPQIKSITQKEAKNPSEFIQTCMEDKIEETINTLSLQGGSMNPGHYYLYMDNKLEYLCYTNENYKTCVIQQPLLTSHIESEIKNEIQEEAEFCFQSLRESYESKGYEVSLKEGDTNVELMLDNIVTTFFHEFTLTKDDVEKTDSFDVVLNNNLYELIMVATSIIDWESKYGDADTSTYMNYYHGLKVEKWNQQDGSTVYILTDKKTDNKFQFASRSIAWPA